MVEHQGGNHHRTHQIQPEFCLAAEVRHDLLKLLRRHPQLMEDDQQHKNIQPNVTSKTAWADALPVKDNRRQTLGPPAAIRLQQRLSTGRVTEDIKQACDYSERQEAMIDKPCQHFGDIPQHDLGHGYISAADKHGADFDQLHQKDNEQGIPENLLIKREKVFTDQALRRQKLVSDLLRMAHVIQHLRHLHFGRFLVWPCQVLQLIQDVRAQLPSNFVPSRLRQIMRHGAHITIKQFHCSPPVTCSDGC